MSSVLAALCVLCVQSVEPWLPEQRETLTVDVNVTLDRAVEHSIAAGFIMALAKNEAAAIWSVHGVELQWSHSIVAALYLDVVVGRHETNLAFDPWPLASASTSSVLGRTTIDDGGVVRGPIL